MTTPSIGLEQPGVTKREPAFAQDLEWTMLAAMGQVGRPDGCSAYFRLSTRPVAQSLADLPTNEALLEARRQQVAAGGYRIASPEGEAVILVGAGAIMPEVIEVADRLTNLGLPVGVVCLTSPDLIFRALQAREDLAADRSAAILDVLLPPDLPTPLVTVLDGHPHTLAFLAGLCEDRSRNLGGSSFGQSSSVQDAYRLHGIDTASIVRAAVARPSRIVRADRVAA